jgi:hypothetical protein
MNNTISPSKRRNLDTKTISFLRELINVDGGDIIFLTKDELALKLKDNERTESLSDCFDYITSVYNMINSGVVLVEEIEGTDEDYLITDHEFAKGLIKEKRGDNKGDDVHLIVIYNGEIITEYNCHYSMIAEGYDIGKFETEYKEQDEESEWNF